MTRATYTIDLDKSPDTRWNHVITDCEGPLKAFAERLDDNLRDQFHTHFPMAYQGLSNVLPYIVTIPEEFEREIKAIAEITAPWGLAYKDVVFLNIALDYMSRCTAAAVPCLNDSHEDADLPVDADLPKVQAHFRTLDWELKALEPLMIRVTFMKNGQDLYTGWTFAGIVGLLTGMRPGAFSVSFNFRKTSLFNLLSPKRKNFAAMTLRQVLQDNASYATAKDFLTFIDMNASAFLVLCGTEPGQAALIIKGPKEYDPCFECLPYVVQTNHHPAMKFIDPFWAGSDPNLLTTIDRRDQVLRHLRTNPEPTLNGLSQVFLTSPIQNDATMLTCVMIPSLGIAHEIPI